MATLKGIRTKAEFIGYLNPKAWDAVKPNIPFVFSNAHVDLMVADVVKNASTLVGDKKIGKQLLALSKEMAEKSSSAVVASWEPGDDICPPWWPWPWPWPGPRGIDVVDPEPVPWKTIGAAEQLDLAYTLTKLSGLTTSKEFNVALKSAATQIARGAASTLADEFERCGTVPRRPFPRPR